MLLVTLSVSALGVETPSNAGVVILGAVDQFAEFSQAAPNSASMRMSRGEEAPWNDDTQQRKSVRFTQDGLPVSDSSSTSGSSSSSSPSQSAASSASSRFVPKLTYCGDSPGPVTFIPDPPITSLLDPPKV